MNDDLRKMSDNGGIYAILNVEKCRVYIGQAENFNNRSHLDILVKGKDSERLQEDYNDIEKNYEFVYFVVSNAGKKPEISEDIKEWKEVLNKYEKLYMTLMEDLNYTLYNKRPKRENRTLDKLGISKARYLEAIKEVEKDFVARFKKTPKELLELDEKGRKDTLDYYADQRIDITNENLALISSDRLIHNKDRFKKILSLKEKSLFEINLDELFVSKAGNYVGEGLDQILKIKKDTINKNGCCLWAFAKNALVCDEIREKCRQQEMKGNDIYVLFSYTPSSAYANTDANKFNTINRDESASLSEEELSMLNAKNLGNGIYVISDDIACTAASKSSVNAFVIEDFFFIEEEFDISKFDNNYYVVQKNNKLVPTVDDTRKMCSTFYYVKNEGEDIIYESIVPNDSNGRTFYFVGKLRAPYLFGLEGESI